MTAVGFTRAYKRLKEQAIEISPDIEVRMLQNGVRAEYRGRKLTFFYKSRTYHDNTIGNYVKWGDKGNKEVDIVRGMFEFEKLKISNPALLASAV